LIQIKVITTTCTHHELEVNGRRTYNRAISSHVHLGVI
jgi:hypothetical protein